MLADRPKAGLTGRPLNLSRPAYWDRENLLAVLAMIIIFLTCAWNAWNIPLEHTSMRAAHIHAHTCMHMRVCVLVCVLACLCLCTLTSNSGRTEPMSIPSRSSSFVRTFSVKTSILIAAWIFLGNPVDKALYINMYTHMCVDVRVDECITCAYMWIDLRTML